MANQTKDSKIPKTCVQLLTSNSTLDCFTEGTKLIMMLPNKGCGSSHKTFSFSNRLWKKSHKKYLIWTPYLILSTFLIQFISSTNGSIGNGNKDHIATVLLDKDGSGSNQDDFTAKSKTTELLPDPLRSLLLASTLDGSLVAIDRSSGQLRWTSKDEPMIRVPSSNGNSDESVKPPFFLPDPRSGSLYVLGSHGQLKKLPFTIPQLVSMAPCRNTEGLLYSGKKMDVWISLDPLTGEKSEVVSFGESTCPAEAGTDSTKPNDRALLIGKSEYTVSMVDGPRKWNVTFNDYSSMEMSPQLAQDYDLVHFTSPSTGTVLTYDRETGELLWQNQLDSPVVGLYSIDGTHSSLISVPFTAVASETLNRLKTPAVARDNSQLSPTLYVGQCAYGLYAVSSLVDETVLTISANKPGLFPYLIEGPKRKPDSVADGTHSNEEDEPSKISSANLSAQENQTDSEVAPEDFVLLGHYEVPETPRPTPMQISSGTILPPPVEVVPSHSNESNPNDEKVISTETPSQQPISSNKPQSQTSNATPTRPGTSTMQFPPLPSKADDIFKKAKSEKDKPFIVLTTALITIAITTTVMSVGFLTFKRFQWKKYGYPVKYLSGTNGIVTVGKINFDPTSILGKGCEGTFVYRGKFENRDIAVKRILPDCFEFADREVALLKESDQHSNVIRYFCTEDDGQFRYIALELCQATLSDWIEGKFQHSGVDSMSVLREATDGLAYLHTLRIVHRDVKPANVLLSVCANTDTVKAMISDFGLCKKITTGRMSFSRRSGGIPGTEGWIAPEMIRNTERTTYAVDIFSLGCVYYYVLTNGEHPFGDAFRRQHNILTNEFVLSHSKVRDNAQGAYELVEKMISVDSAERPPLSAIQQHPIFWSHDKILSFFLDVSDRIEKENESTCPVLRKLETETSPVIRHDWRDHICADVAMDLRKYRTYKGYSIRDLLRALRNKKNHYRELTPEAQASLGHIPDQFVMYWLSRFPLLLSHTWKKFETIKFEPIFTKYYPPDYTWFPAEQENIESPDVLLNPEFYGNAPVVMLSEYQRKKFESEGIPTPPSSPFHEINNQNQIRKRNNLDKNFWKSNKSQYRYNKWKKSATENTVQESFDTLPPRSATSTTPATNLNS